MDTMQSQATGLTTKKFARQTCSRCSGHMVPDMCIDLESDNGHSTCRVLRCIQCGDIVDEVILQNRAVSNPLAQCVAAA
jgi:RNase P subunit RPR2